VKWANLCLAVCGDRRRRDRVRADGVAIGPRRSRGLKPALHPRQGGGSGAGRQAAHDRGDRAAAAAITNDIGGDLFGDIYASVAFRGITAPVYARAGDLGGGRARRA
jgi:hypothetical protein